MTHSVTAQRAYHARFKGVAHAERVQAEAERLALIDGNPEEAKRRRNAGMDLAKKRRSTEAKPVAAYLIRDLGPRDTIGNMLKDRALTEAQGKAALLLREHHEGATITLEGSGVVVDFIDRQSQAGLEAWCDRRKRGHEAWRLAMEATDHPKAIRIVVLGNAGKAQARRLIGGRGTTADAVLLAELRKALDAAGAYLGAGA